MLGGTLRYALLVVDEVEEFPTVRFGDPEDFSLDASSKEALLKNNYLASSLIKVTQAKVAGKPGIFSISASRSSKSS